MERRGGILVIGVAHLVLTVLLGARWMWCFAWQQAAISDMSEDLVNSGALNMAEAAKLGAGTNAVDVYLQQGWGDQVALWGMGLLAVSLGGAGALIAIGLHARAARVTDAA